jgi:hypothetical protein
MIPHRHRPNPDDVAAWDDLNQSGAWVAKDSL